ncbi:hypothetical protein CK203_084470 [Vitis vinifera]|uniref:Uncharacterized protein n=1 Tax=Vitis vinifera TaxID=29760 RepID=A0A438EGC2_VITVI|nr:hypothetical protein CK203_084470 [Vitis vinifera]
MILPVVKLGTLALKTMCKPIGTRIKKDAGLHPKFRQFIINIAQSKLIRVGRVNNAEELAFELDVSFRDRELNFFSKRAHLEAMGSKASFFTWEVKEGLGGHSEGDFARANHRFTTTMQRRIYGHATNVEIRPLNEEKAVQAAADLVGELFVFTVVLTLSPITVICIKD